VRNYRKTVLQQSKVARSLYQLKATLAMLPEGSDAAKEVESLIQTCDSKLHEEPRRLLDCWDQLKQSYCQEALITKVRDKEIRTELYTTTISGTRIPKVCTPDYNDWGDLLSWLMLENLPGFSLTQQGFSPSNGLKKIPSVSLPEKEALNGQTDVFTTSARMTAPSGSPPPLTASPSTAQTRTIRRIFTARWVKAGFQSALLMI